VRRWPLVGISAIASIALLSGCAGAERPEGVVERWLISLNQGAAGQPQRFAAEAVSQELLPAWSSRSPGALDVIEVGHGRSFGSMRFPEGAARVPFRVVRVSGRSVRGTALLEREPAAQGGGWTVIRLEPPSPGLPLPSEGGPAIETAPPSMWLEAFAAAAGFVVLSWVSMEAIRRHRPRAAQTSSST
jgi:hypothetical protein